MLAYIPKKPCIYCIKLKLLLVDSLLPNCYNHSMKNKELAHYVKWVATTITLSGAVLASLNIYPYSAVTLNIGAGLFLIWAILVKDRAMITVNLGLLLIYSTGLAIKSL
jgi:hypothetical protein